MEQYSHWLTFYTAYLYGLLLLFVLLILGVDSKRMIK